MRFLCGSIIWICCALCNVQKLHAQAALAGDKLLYSTEQFNAAPDSVQLFNIKKIIIEGNKKTKEYIILREISFREDEQYTLKSLVEQFAKTKKQLMNSGLFLQVIVSLKSLQGFDAYIKIEVKERWYLYPIPYIKAIDRSIGEWVKDQNMDLNRVNYGVKLTYNNATGRNDRLYTHLTNGYTKQVSLSYRGLYLDSALRWTSSFGLSVGKNKEVNYKTDKNKLQFFKHSNNYVLSFLRSYLEFAYRPVIKTTHTFGLQYTVEDVADTVITLNPSYNHNQQKISFPEVYYTLLHLNTDFNPYPTKGYIGELSFRKKGISQPINMWQFSAKGSLFKPIIPKYYFNLKAAGLLKLPFKQPYINQQLLGFNGMFMQGYEYYVVDGVAGGYTKASISRELINTVFHIPSKKIERLNHIPFRVYAKVYGNAGYVYNPEPGPNMLCNKMLYSGGVGLDIIAFYDFIIKLEWSFNQLRQNDLYLHRKEYF